jgi:hypothetical protein
VMKPSPSRCSTVLMMGLMRYRLLGRG